MENNVRKLTFKRDVFDDMKATSETYGRLKSETRLSYQPLDKKAENLLFFNELSIEI